MEDVLKEFDKRYSFPCFACPFGAWEWMQRFFFLVTKQASLRIV